MQCFQENYCRLCPKVLCCIRCRREHEENIHNINPDCEICVYGRTTINQASISLLTHIKNVHWPLHCVFCKKIFSTLDDLVLHNKCAFQIKNMKVQGTPKTPVTPVSDKNEPSPEVTPFYKSLKPIGQQLPSIITMAVTSTPLLRKDGIDRITPINQSQINCIHKSNLKLTGSSNLSDSKKSDRRVTFSDTPSVSEFCKKPKHLPLTEQIKDSKEEDENSSDESYVSMTEEEENFKTAPVASQCEDKENADHRLVIFNEKCDSNGTLWESALTKLDFNASTIPESIENKATHVNVNLQINVFNNTTLKSVDNSNLNSNDAEDKSFHNKSTTIWSSMTNIVKSVVHNISATAQNSFSSVSIKRSQPDPTDNDPDGDPTEVPSLKRMKLTELRCRRPIREIRPLYHIRLAKPRYVDKATQTEEYWL